MAWKLHWYKYFVYWSTSIWFLNIVLSIIWEVHVYYLRSDFCSNPSPLSPLWWLFKWALEDPHQVSAPSLLNSTLTPLSPTNMRVGLFDTPDHRQPVALSTFLRKFILTSLATISFQQLLSYGCDCVSYKALYSKYLCLCFINILPYMTIFMLSNIRL